LIMNLFQELFLSDMLFTFTRDFKEAL
jgi:hypothetical protein